MRNRLISNSRENCGIPGNDNPAVPLLTIALNVLPNGTAGILTTGKT